MPWGIAFFTSIRTTIRMILLTADPAQAIRLVRVSLCGG